MKPIDKLADYELQEKGANCNHIVSIGDDYYCQLALDLIGKRSVHRLSADQQPTDLAADTPCSIVDYSQCVYNKEVL